MPQNSKLFAYIGFSIKSGKVKFGYDAIALSPQKVKVILCDKSLGKSGMKKVLSVAEGNGIFLHCFEAGELDLYCGNKNCKCIGLTDAGLASAVKEELKKLSEVID